ncbi:MAG: MCE family protein [Saprospiraceae bacterium]|nr:MCE family protein [Saprospiraceae bacterium]
MSISNEVKIGLLGIVALALSFWGYKFIMGKNLLVKSNVYKVLYATTEGMQTGTQVRIHGVEVGNVASIELLPDKEKKVLVTLELQRGISIPKTTKAIIVSTGFMGGKAINLMYDNPCEGDNCAKSGDFLEGDTYGLLTSMVGEDNVRAYMDVIEEGLKEVFDVINEELLKDETKSPLAATIKELQRTLANLTSATAQLDVLLKKSSGNIDGTLANLNSLSGELNAKKGEIAGIVDNANAITAQLKEADLKKTILEVQVAVADLQKTLKTADKALGGMSTTVESLNSGQGSIGKLLKDDKLYDDIKRLSSSADSLLSDFQNRPYRYMPLKSRRAVKKYDKQDGTF